jgi:MFS family permease
VRREAADGAALAVARDLRWFYLFRLLSTSYLFVPVMVFFPSSRGLDIVHVLLLGTIYCGTVIVSEVPTGALADRIGRRRAMMLGALVMVAACLVYFVSYRFWTFALAETLAALSMTLCSGADSAYLFDLLNDNGRVHEYPRREGTASTWHQGGQTLAFAAGGLLGAYDLALPYLVSAGVATLAFFVALSMRDDKPRAQVRRRLPGAGEMLAQMRDAFRAVGRQRRLQWVIAYSAIVFVLLRATIYIYQPYLQQAGYGLRATGLVFAGVYLLAAVVAHHSNGLRQRMSSGTLLWLLGGTLVATFLILGALPGGPWAIGVLAIQAAANGLYSPLVKPLLNDEIDDSRRRATVLSVESMARRVAFGLFCPAIGQVMKSWGTSAGLTVCGVFGLLGLLLLARSSDKLFARPASEPGGVARLTPKAETSP